jgi:hypothetical protein
MRSTKLVPLSLNFIFKCEMPLFELQIVQVIIYEFSSVFMKSVNIPVKEQYGMYLSRYTLYQTFMVHGWIWLRFTDCQNACIIILIKKLMLSKLASWYFSFKYLPYEISHSVLQSVGSITSVPLYSIGADGNIADYHSVRSPDLVDLVPADSEALCDLLPQSDVDKLSRETDKDRLEREIEIER